MNFVKSLSMFHVDAKEIPCLPGKGAPTAQTEGAPGVLYMDTDTGEMYKCTAADYVNGVITWKPLLEGNVSSDSSKNVELDTTLTQSGKAADAKAVGDAIKNIPSFNIYVLKDGETLDDVPDNYYFVNDPNGEPDEDSYSKAEIDAMFGEYIAEVAELVGGDA